MSGQQTAVAAKEGTLGDRLALPLIADIAGHQNRDTAVTAQAVIDALAGEGKALASLLDAKKHTQSGGEQIFWFKNTDNSPKPMSLRQDAAPKCQHFEKQDWAA